MCELFLFRPANLQTVQALTGFVGIDLMTVPNLPKKVPNNVPITSTRMHYTSPKMYQTNVSMTKRRARSTELFSGITYPNRAADAREYGEAPHPAGIPLGLATTHRSLFDLPPTFARPSGIPAGCGVSPYTHASTARSGWGSFLKKRSMREHQNHVLASPKRIALDRLIFV